MRSPGVEAAREDDLDMLAERWPASRDGLRAALSGQPPGAWAVVTDDRLGYAVYTTLFSTWQGRDAIDVLRLAVLDGGSVAVHGDALLRAVVAHAAELGSRSVRWLRAAESDERVVPLFTGAEVLDKVRFELPVTGAVA